MIIYVDIYRYIDIDACIFLASDFLIASRSGCAFAAAWRKTMGPDGRAIFWATSFGEKIWEAGRVCSCPSLSNLGVPSSRLPDCIEKKVVSGCLKIRHNEASGIWGNTVHSPNVYCVVLKTRNHELWRLQSQDVETNQVPSQYTGVE